MSANDTHEPTPAAPMVWDGTSKTCAFASREDWQINGMLWCRLQRCENHRDAKCTCPTERTAALLAQLDDAAMSAVIERAVEEGMVLSHRDRVWAAQYPAASYRWYEANTPTDAMRAAREEGAKRA